MHSEWAEKFWARVDKSGECWVWIGSRLPRGYGRFYPKWKVGLYAHRVSWEMANGRDIPVGFDVCHTCDNPPCVRPDHLFIGTKSDNAQDSVLKGRHTKTGLPGERHPSARLTDGDVVLIRELWATGKYRQRELAERFKVSRALIGYIVRRVNWKHL